MCIQAIVKKKRKTRIGKGFSRGELEEVGLGLRQASRLGIPIDSRRRSKHSENVKALRKYLRRGSEKTKRLIMFKS